MEGDHSLGPGGALHRAVAGLHDGRSAYTTVYHPLVVGKRIKTRGVSAPLEIEEIPGWRELTAAVTPEEVTATTGATAYVWKASEDRVLTSDADVDGAARFDRDHQGRWRRHAYPRDETCDWPDCANRSATLCALHAGKLLLGGGHPNAERVRRLDAATIPPEVEALRKDLRRRLLLRDDEESLSRALGRFFEAATHFSEDKTSTLVWADPESRFDVKKGSSVSFVVVATGGSRFEWLKDDDDEKESRHSTNRARLVVRGVDVADEGQYRCRIDGLVSSASASLTVEGSAKEVDALKRDFDHARFADVDECVAALRYDVDDDKFNASVLLRLARLTKKHKALYYASDAAARWPSSVEAHLLKAQLARDLGYFEEALRAVEAAERLRPTLDRHQRLLRALKTQVDRLLAEQEEKEKNPPVWRRRRPTRRNQDDDNFNDDDDNEFPDDEGNAAPKPPQQGQQVPQRAEDLFIFGLSAMPPSRRDLRRIYIDLALTQHPDKGGDHDAFLRIQGAYERLTRALLM
mmetsp:Transcript_8324/g.27258  ORF Transcript_8324/g.27258 Transcript_8324/m.27258 type:complete len:521 (-) Transcript_8324:367-1929(-)